MRDKRSVDELSIEELERVLAIRRRKERHNRLNRLQAEGRVVEVPPTPAAVKPVTITPPSKPVEADLGEANPAAITLDALDAILERKDASPRFEEPVSVVSHVIPPPQDIARYEQYDDDGYDLDERSLTHKPAPSAGKRVVNGVLLLVEVGAVFALIFLGVNLYISMTDLQRESAEVQSMADAQRRNSIPTAAPTSVIQVAKLEDFLLPGGHIVDVNGNPYFNFDELVSEVPSHLQAQVQSQVYAVNFVRPQPLPETAVNVFIPRLGINQTIVQGTDWEALKLGVGQVLNGALPGETDSNVALAAHNDIFGALFERIDELEPNDVIQLQTENMTYTYRVTSFEIVNPSDVHVLESQGRPTVTLITCYPLGVNNKRYIVYATREDAIQLQG